MNLLLAVLLYLNIISPNNTYYKSYVNAEQQSLSTQIDGVEADPAKMNIVNGTYMPEVNTIVIIDDTMGG
jgi:hypothetical protein